MPINKKALTRYLAYDRCLRNFGRKYTWKDLVTEANKALEEEGLEGIGKTQFYADMQFMELSDWKAPIEREKCGKTVYFKYTDATYSINNQPLSETEANQLKSAISILTRLNGTPQFEWVNEMIPSLQTKLGLIGVGKEVISFENNLDYKGLVFITPIFNAIINKRVLHISYQDFKSPLPYDIELHPQYLKQYNNRWFVFGYNSEKQVDCWNLALDRIQSIHELGKEYINSKIQWDDYFYDLIGVTKQASEKVMEVKLLFTPDQAPYVITKPLHPTQKHKNGESGLEVVISVIPNYELEKLILSFGECVKVIAPLSLRLKVAERARNVIKSYEQLVNDSSK